ncbi:MAG: GIY-YIG nuclease family protein [Thermoleophilaceae bacterium]
MGRCEHCAIAAFVYLLRCSDASLYCGWSTDPRRRLEQHQAGSASRYTRSRRPVELVWTFACESRSEAMREEARVKRLSASQKRALISAALRSPPGGP